MDLIRAIPPCTDFSFFQQQGMKQLALSPCQDTTTAVCACPATPLELRDLSCLSWLLTTGSKHAKFELKKKSSMQ